MGILGGVLGRAWSWISILLAQDIPRGAVPGAAPCLGQELLHPPLQQNTKMGTNKAIFKRYLTQKQMLFPTPSTPGKHLEPHVDLLCFSCFLVNGTASGINAEHVSSQSCRCESSPHYRGLREGNAPAWNSRLQIPGPERLRLPEHKLGEKQTLRTQKGLCQTSWFFSSSSKVGKGPGISLGKLQCSSMLTPASWWTRGHKRRNCRH